MKYPLFDSLGKQYPFALEQRYERILKKIVELWHTPEIDDYFTSLLIDTRGGRQGFEPEVFQDIHRLHKLRESERFREVHGKLDAIRDLERQGVVFRIGNFLEAVQAGDQTLVDLFVRAGINIHVSHEDGTPPIIIALKKGYTVVANILLVAGANPNARDNAGFTPLLLACGKSAKGYKEIARKLIRLGADVNVRDPLGWTPLLLAVSGGAEEVVALLLEHGADPTVRTRKGEGAMDLVQKFGKEHLIEVLFAKGSDKFFL